MAKSKEDMHARMAALRAMRKSKVNKLATTSTPTQMNGKMGGQTARAVRQMAKLGMSFHGKC